MSHLTRREWLHCAAAAAAGVCLARRPSNAADTPAAASKEIAGQGLTVPDLGLTAVGAIRPRKAASIKASPLGVGFETLDRRHFDPQKTFPHMAELGAKWARCQTGWGRTETVKDKFDFAWLDEVVDGLLKVGVQPWFNLGYGNQLYTPEAKSEAAVGFVPQSDDAKAAWLRYVEKIAAHYAGRVKVWEIWNEPNIEGFWKPDKPDPAAYVELVRMTAPKIRKRVPDAVIVGAALAGVPIGYLKGCLEAGLGELVDKVSYHPYRENPESNYEKDVAAMRVLLKPRADGRSIALWQGESGAPSVPGGAGALAKAAWTETRQAKWLLRRILSDLRLDVELTSYFLIVDLVGYRGSTNYKGLLRGTTYAPKPAYRAYQHLCALFDAESKRADLPMTIEGADGATVLHAAFRRHGRPIYAYWTPAPLLKDFQLGKIDATIPDAADVKLKTPVLADPLTGKIYALAAAARREDRWLFAALPLADYPLLLTDAEVVQ